MRKRSQRVSGCALLTLGCFRRHLPVQVQGVMNILSSKHVHWQSLLSSRQASHQLPDVPPTGCGVAVKHNRETQH